MARAQLGTPWLGRELGWGGCSPRAHCWCGTLGWSPLRSASAHRPCFPSLPTAMKGGVCLCVLMAVLAAGALAQPVAPAAGAEASVQRAEEAPRRQLRAVPRDGEPRARLGALLARYIQQVRKGKDACSGSAAAAPGRPCTRREEGTGAARGARSDLSLLRCAAPHRAVGTWCWQHRRAEVASLVAKGSRLADLSLNGFWHRVGAEV